LRNALIPELGCNEKETRFKNTKTGRHRYSVKILDFYCLNFIFFMVNRDLKEVTILALQKEEEGALWNYINQNIRQVAKDQPSFCA